jgi:protein-S-isoprenylcysteine O-methyltransferase Ste14
MLVFIVIWSIWFISEILLNRFCRSKDNDKQSADMGSLRIIWITIGIANSLGILTAVFIELPISGYVLVQYIGLVIIVCGIIFRFISILSLGKFFTVDVTIRKEHKIKKDGMYRLIRHPSYTGSLVSFLGFGISLNNLLSLVLIFVPVFFAMLHRIAIEEKFLIDQFGTEYTDYMKKTHRLIPWLF